MVTNKLVYKEKILQTLDIQDRLVKDSNRIDPVTKAAFLNFSNINRQQLESNFTLTQLKSFANEILTFWRESIGVDVEKFWTELNIHHIEFERRDELQFALAKGRFRRVDMGMAARKDWSLLKTLDSIKQRFSENDLLRLDTIIQQDEATRLELLKKCLQKQEIPQSKYLKFGECMAYFSRCDLFSQYFSPREIEDLHKVWTNFKSK